jgi:hypothetical protein
MTRILCPCYEGDWTDDPARLETTIKYLLV